jgi:replication fork protection complex subunit Csm3/Swi3
MTSLESSNRPLPSGGPSAGGDDFDDFDDLFNYDVDDVADLSNQPAKTAESSKNGANKKKIADGLGIDEAIDITRKPRAPRVKLDENRSVPKEVCNSSLIKLFQAAICRRNSKIEE